MFCDKAAPKLSLMASTSMMNIGSKSRYASIREDMRLVFNMSNADWHSVSHCHVQPLSSSRSKGNVMLENLFINFL
ncbi:hypothetical protein T4B_1972 [Trichinella pseudospiralis]|uniref:Uncharacterized protein n=1 Tax=Trichinella pseudospiralis TaxID=6337 RepID=A0A0V1JFJ5_TRIPS|nr:hypothetical protein T4B_1972 [Trichinella pseudospiralis]